MIYECKFCHNMKVTPGRSAARTKFVCELCREVILRNMKYANLPNKRYYETKLEELFSNKF